MLCHRSIFGWAIGGVELACAKFAVSVQINLVPLLFRSFSVFATSFSWWFAIRFIDAP